MHKSFRTPDVIPKVQALHQQGLDVGVIAERLSISRQTVWRIIKMEAGNERSGTETESTGDGD